MIHTQFHMTSRDDKINLTFEYGYKCDYFMKSVVSSWKYNAKTKSLVFVINEYEITAIMKNNNTLSICISNSDGVLCSLPYKHYVEFMVTDKSILIESGEESHRFYYV